MALALYPNGNVLASGSFGLRKLTPSGSTAGALLAAQELLGNYVPAVCLQRDGRIAALGNNGLLQLAPNESVAEITPPRSLRAYGFPSLAVQPDGRILVAGATLLFGAATMPPLVRLMPNGEPDPTFATPGLTGPVEAMAVQDDGRILIGGRFSGIGRTGLARLLPHGAPDPSFADSTRLNSNVRFLAIHPNNRLLIGGNFTTVGAAQRPYVARIIVPNLGGPAPSGRPAPEPPGELGIYPIPASDQVTISLPTATAFLEAKAYDTIGRLVLTHTAASKDTKLWVRNLPSGTYLLRVRYEGGMLTRRLLVLH